MLSATARLAPAGDPEALDIRTLPLVASILRDCAGPEYLIIEDGPRRLRLQLRGDSIVDGPVRLTYDVEGVRQLEPTILGLRRLSAIGRLGRLPRALFPPDPIVARKVHALQAWDGASRGASQRDIAAVIFGGHMVTDASFDSMRKRVNRLLIQADRHISSGRRRFFTG